jgi:hypothetical protein
MYLISVDKNSTSTVNIETSSNKGIKKGKVLLTLPLGRLLTIKHV